MLRLHVPVEVSSSDQHLPTQGAHVGGEAAGVEPHVLVEVARVPEGPLAELALQGLVPSVCADMNLQAVLPGVDLPAIHAQVALLHLAPVARE